MKTSPSAKRRRADLMTELGIEAAQLVEGAYVDLLEAANV